MFSEITSKEIRENIFEMIGSKWMLVSAKKSDGKVNAMTASWGGMGVMWGKDVAFVVIRPQRYTKEFVDEAESFSLTFFDSSHKKMLGYMGSVSGRDEDKMAKSGLTVLDDNGVPYYEECETAIICKKLFNQELTQDSFLFEDTINKWYPDKDYHTLYIGEIEKVIAKK